MSDKTRWQFCQIDVDTYNRGVFKQFIADRPPTETDLHGNWPGMLAKLGEQGWDLVSVNSDSKRGTSTYVLKRSMSTPISGASSPPPPPPPPSSPPPPPPEDDPPGQEFEPLRGN